ncbi:membrane protein [Streptococcus varani]|jgi:uncharacterized integral membrane protein|uniref:Membrane protein n=1 Tax=Streptococcus varani TaxID=1608583 RepID=A0A0E4CTE0_9STRE|nr:DUF3270 family protein [Streptococcus varani]CQR25648.1 membrane protein [Streptococcus varani]
MALRQERPDQFLYEEQFPKEQQVRYQEYQTRKPYENRLRDLLFFINLAIFSIITVMATYVYLSVNFPAFLAFVLGIATGFLALRVIQIALRKQYMRMKLKKRSK